MHGLVGRHDGRKRFRVAQLRRENVFTQERIFATHFTHLERASCRCQKIFFGYGFYHVIKRACLHTLDRCFDLVDAGSDNHGNIRVTLHDQRQELTA